MGGSGVNPWRTFRCDSCGQSVSSRIPDDEWHRPWHACQKRGGRRYPMKLIEENDGRKVG